MNIYLHDLVLLTTTFLLSAIIYFLFSTLSMKITRFYEWDIRRLVYFIQKRILKMFPFMWALREGEEDIFVNKEI